MKIAYLTTWLPRACGIATFADDLAMAIDGQKTNIDWKVIVIDDPEKKYKYDSNIIIHKLDQFNPASFNETAEFINKSDIDLLVIHHEFNLYNKTGESRILSFLKTLKKPRIMILHSIPHPNDRKYNNKKRKIEVIRKASLLVDQMVVMCQAAKQRLVDFYKIKFDKITVIPHGSPEFSLVDENKMKIKLGYKNIPMLLNFGFIGRRKGLETIIKSIQGVVKKFPLAKLIIMGGVNPSFKEGFKKYHEELSTLIERLNIKNNVEFIAGFIPLTKVREYFQASDIFVYANNFTSQVSSGPLTYAYVAGKPIVVTKFTYAEDLLKNGGGIIVPTKDYHSMAKAVCKILGNPKLKDKMTRDNYKRGQNFLWNQIAEKYIQLFRKVK